MPMAGPPGQHIEQVVDENGVLTSVIVTNQMAPPYQQPPPAPPNSTPVQGSNQQPIQVQGFDLINSFCLHWFPH